MYQIVIGRSGEWAVQTGGQFDSIDAGIATIERYWREDKRSAGIPGSNGNCFYYLIPAQPERVSIRIVDARKIAVHSTANVGRDWRQAFTADELEAYEAAKAAFFRDY